jgi:hypothetical protein
VCRLLKYVNDPRALAGKDKLRLLTLKGLTLKKLLAFKKIQARMFRLPELLDWDLTRICKEIDDELDWVVPPEFNGDTEIYHSDCVCNPITTYMNKKRWGFAQDSISYSALVRRGHMPREKALSRVKKCEAFEKPPSLAPLSERMDMPVEELGIDLDWYNQPIQSS